MMIKMMIIAIIHPFGSNISRIPLTIGKIKDIIVNILTAGSSVSHMNPGRRALNKSATRKLVFFYFSANMLFRTDDR